MRLQKVRDKIDWVQTSPSVLLWVLGLAWTFGVCWLFNKTANEILTTKPEYALILGLAVVMNTLCTVKNIPLPYLVRDHEVVVFEAENKVEAEI